MSEDPVAQVAAIRCHCGRYTMALDQAVIWQPVDKWMYPHTPDHCEPPAPPRTEGPNPDVLAAIRARQERDDAETMILNLMSGMRSAYECGKTANIPLFQIQELAIRQAIQQLFADRATLLNEVETLTDLWKDAEEVHRLAIERENELQTRLDRAGEEKAALEKQMDGLRLGRNASLDIVYGKLQQAEAEVKRLRLVMIESTANCSTDYTDFSMASLGAEGWRILCQELDELLTKASGELHRLKVAYANGLEQHVEPPDLVLLDQLAHRTRFPQGGTTAGPEMKAP